MNYEIERDYYTLQAYTRAFGPAYDHGWTSDLGYGANRGYIVQLYGYYTALYNLLPENFLWAGLGKMAGGAVVGGLDRMVLFHTDPSLATTTMVQIGKEIFLDLAWQHEAFLVDPQNAIALAREHDVRRHPRRSYAAAWEQIADGFPYTPAAQVAAGNAMLLENEQYDIIQPLYELDAQRHQHCGTNQRVHERDSPLSP